MNNGSLRARQLQRSVSGVVRFLLSTMSERKIPQSVGADSVYLATPGAADEAQLAIDISIIGAAGAGAATFCPLLPVEGAKAVFETAWNEWLSQRFVSVLGGPFCRIHASAGQMRMDEIVRADADIDAALNAEEKRRSLAAAQAFLEGREKVRHMPQLVRLTDAIGRGETPGHVTTLFAMQAGLYHLPRLAALVSYAYFEWLGGVVATGWKVERDMTAFETGYPQTFASVRSILHAESVSSDEGDSSIFRVE